MGRATGLTHNMQTSSGNSLEARRACSTCCRCTAFRGRTSLRGARRVRGDGQNAAGRVFLPAAQQGSCKERPCAAAWPLRAPIAFLQLLALIGEDSRCLVGAARQRHARAWNRGCWHFIKLPCTHMAWRCMDCEKQGVRPCGVVRISFSSLTSTLGAPAALLYMRLTHLKRLLPANCSGRLIRPPPSEAPMPRPPYPTSRGALSRRTKPSAHGERLGT